MVFVRDTISVSQQKPPCHFWQRGDLNFRSTIDFVWDYKSLANKVTIANRHQRLHFFCSYPYEQVSKKM